jgi:hypothetical protein
MKQTKEEALNALIKEADKNKISDGYHTFGELYDHRNILFVKLAKLIKEANTHHVWRSIKQSDGSIDNDWFIMGVCKDAGEQISYHLPIALWTLTMFAETLDKAPEWDGHTSNDVLNRLIILGV